LNNLDLKLTRESFRLSSHWTSPPSEMSTLILKKSVSRKGCSPQTPAELTDSYEQQRGVLTARDLRRVVG